VRHSSGFFAVALTKQSEGRPLAHCAGSVFGHATHRTSPAFWFTMQMVMIAGFLHGDPVAPIPGSLDLSP
jgi:hypothetical protein